MMADAQRKAGEITDAAAAKAQEIADEAQVERTRTLSQVSAEVEQIRNDIAAQQEEATKKVNELISGLKEREHAAQEEADALVARAKTVHQDADNYAAQAHKDADAQAAQIVRKAMQDATAQVEERRAAAQQELDGMTARLTQLQHREAQITQRVTELRSLFANAFSGFDFGDAASEQGHSGDSADADASNNSNADSQKQARKDAQAQVEEAIAQES